ncbi:hypothetical protein EOL94_00165 [bacterium]|nr:hypothetical protein [bacterium]
MLNKNRQSYILKDIVKTIEEIEKISMTPATCQVKWQEYKGFNAFEKSYETEDGTAKIFWKLLPAVGFSVEGLDEINLFINDEQKAWYHRRPNNSFGVPDPDEDGEKEMRKFYSSYYSNGILGADEFSYKTELIQIRKELRKHLRQMRQDVKRA